ERYVPAETRRADAAAAVVQGDRGRHAAAHRLEIERHRRAVAAGSGGATAEAGVGGLATVVTARRRQLRPRRRHERSENDEEDCDYTDESLRMGHVGLRTRGSPGWASPLPAGPEQVAYLVVPR